MNIWLAVVLVLIGFIVGYFVGIGRGTSINHDPIGQLNLVEWKDGTIDTLLESSVPPSDLYDGQMIVLYVRKTRR
jgi:hypothetical protein